MPSLIDLPAPAKVNLFLHITGRRPDGYHLIQSVFMLIDWQDTLHIHTRPDGAIHRHDLTVALPSDDLCLKAARLLQRESGSSLGCDIEIAKRVPWGAGLGGGSSDAATVLLALNQLWGLHWPRSRLESLALRLGADVPFFVRGRNAWVEGVGEVITPINLPEEVLNTPLALLKPPASIPTSAIFGSPNLKRDTKHAILADFLAAPQRFGRNDMQPCAEQSSSQITQALRIMQNQFGNSRMSGSGSTVFAWMGDQTPHTSLNRPASRSPFTATELGLNDPDWVGIAVRGLAQHPLLDALTPING
jgi:4-diphosphocytidyl-2-C-methyl-D-erythritol kinase